MVDQVMECNYLRVNIICLGNLKKEIKIQTQKAVKVAGSLNDLVWRKIYMRKETI